MPQQWRMANLRFTAFVSQIPFPVDGEELFQSFFGFTHDTETRRKGEFMSEFSSEKGGVLYQTTISGPKIDFTVSPGFALAEVPDEMPSLPTEGHFEASFNEAANRLLEIIPALVRLAVGGHFIFPAADKETGYTLLGKFLPTVKIDPIGSSDFQYRINRRREIELGERKVTINRLVTWGCLGFNVQVMGSSASRASDSVSAITDVNTDPSTDVPSFSTEDRKLIVSSLFSFSRELAEKGDLT